MPPSPSNASKINQSSYSSPSIAKYWATYNENLLYGEQIIFNDILSLFQESRFLDLGVGGGRTTKHLLPLVSDYLGIDYSAPLVDYCKLRYPDARFQLLDVCQLHTIYEASFDFAFFSFNGIDCLSALQRSSFYHSVYKALASNGYLLFSSHNLSLASLKLSRRDILKNEFKLLLAQRSLSPRNYYHSVRSLLNYFANRDLQEIRPDSAFLLDRAQGYRELLAWIDPDRQVKDLADAGFNVIQIYSWQGEKHEINDTSLHNSPSVYYLCQRL